MATYIGVDIECNERFDGLDEQSSFVKKVYTGDEIAYCFGKQTPAQHLAARFAAKEAVTKALAQAGVRTLMTAVEVGKDGELPYVKKPSIDGLRISISISHCLKYSMAAALVETQQ